MVQVIHQTPSRIHRRPLLDIARMAGREVKNGQRQGEGRVLGGEWEPLFSPAWAQRLADGQLKHN